MTKKDKAQILFQVLASIACQEFCHVNFQGGVCAFHHQY